MLRPRVLLGGGCPHAGSKLANPRSSSILVDIEVPLDEESTPCAVSIYKGICPVPVLRNAFKRLRASVFLGFLNHAGSDALGQE